MSILATIFVRLFDSECSVSFSKRTFFAAFASALQKSQKRDFFNLNVSQNLPKLFTQYATAALYNLKVVTLLFAKPKLENYYNFIVLNRGRI